MWVLSWSLVAVGWFAWLYPFLFRVPHRQRRESIAVTGPTRVGLLLEGLAIFLAFAYRGGGEPASWRVAVAAVLIGTCGAMAWKAVTHLGRQFRIHAGLYHDHELVRTGPYALVRHPIYTSMMGMLVATMLLLGTQPAWAAIALLFFVAGTEARVRAEDHLLASRFGAAFHEYQKRVRAYIPFVR
jgi:protein-S-isoprenylcysteine O-methyltransferase Ste14